MNTQEIVAKLWNLCNVLRDDGITYHQYVTELTYILFLKMAKDNTKTVWFYDLRTNMPSFGKTNPLKASDFAGFEAAYNAEDRSKLQDERWQCFTREEIAAKGNSLDLGLIKDDSVLDYEALPDPAESAAEAAQKLAEAVDLLESVAQELKSLQK